MYKQSRQSRPSVVETNSTSVELSLPVDEDYIIQIKSVSEGGEGSSSKQITIPRIAGLLIALTVFITIILQYAELNFFLGYHVNNAIFGNYIKYTKQVKENHNIYHTIWNCEHLVCFFVVCWLSEILFNFLYLYFAVAHAIGFAPERKALPVLITLSLCCTVRTFLWQMNWTLRRREQHKDLQVDPLVFFQYVLQTRLFRRKVFLSLFKRGCLLIWF